MDVNNEIALIKNQLKEAEARVKQLEEELNNQKNNPVVEIEANRTYGFIDINYYMQHVGEVTTSIIESYESGKMVKQESDATNRVKYLKAFNKCLSVMDNIKKETKEEPADWSAHYQDKFYPSLCSSSIDISFCYSESYSPFNFTDRENCRAFIHICKEELLMILKGE